MSNETRFDSIEDGIKAIARGEMVICVDDEDRENEGDLICAAENHSGNGEFHGGPCTWTDLHAHHRRPRQPTDAASNGE